MLYVGILDGKKGRWGVRIPDLPGAFGGGRTAEAAIADAMSAAREWAATQLASGGRVPKARQVAEILADPSTDFDAKIGESLVMINVLLERGRSVKANVSIDAGTLEAIDTEAERQGLTRSSFMASAALEKIERVGE